MKFTRRNIGKMKRNGETAAAVSASVTNNVSKGQQGSYLPAIPNGDGTYTVSVSCVRFLGNVFGEKEITAWKIGGNSEGGQGGKIIIDTVLSPVSENPVQNKVIYATIGDMSSLTTTAKGSIVDAINEAMLKGGSGAEVDLSGYATQLWVRQQGYLTAIPAEYITETELNEALNNIHTHTNKAVLDKISETNYQSWNKVVQNWDKAFYFDSEGNIRVKLNLVGEKEVSAWKVGDSSTAPAPGLITIVDNLFSTSAEAALSANQGRVLKQMIEDKTIDMSDYYNVTDIDNLLRLKASITYVNQKISDLVNGAPETMDTLKELSDALATNKSAVDAINAAITNKADKVHYHYIADIYGLSSKIQIYDSHVSDTTLHITAEERAMWNAKLDKSVWDKAFYFDSEGNIRVKLNLIGEKEVSAWKVGDSSTAPTPGLITIVDNLFSTSAEAALSANQGRVLKQMIEEKTVDMTGYATEEWVKNQGYLKTFVNNYLSSVDGSGNGVLYFYRYGLNPLSINLAHTHSQYLTSIPSEYITEDELNTELRKLHTHTNLEVLNKISESNYQSWNKVVSNWNAAFYFDTKGNIRAKLNLIGEKEITAWQIGESGTAPTPGLITIVDNLFSTATDAALSANQGRVLKKMIENKSVDLTGYATRTWVQQQGYLTGYTNNYVNSVTDNGTNGNYLVVTFNRAGLTSLTLDLSHSHSQYITAHQSLTHLANRDGTNVNGTWNGLSIGGNASTATSISGETPQLASSQNGNNEIVVVNNANSSIVHNRPVGKNLTAISKAVDYRWYDNHYQTGIIRGDTIDDLGWGITRSNNTLVFRVNETGAYVGKKEIYHSGNLEISDNFRKKYDVDLTGLSVKDFYPVCFAPSVFELDCEIHSPSMSESSTYNQNHIHFLMTSKGWSDTRPRLLILSQGNHTDKEICIGAIGRGKENGNIAVWLRGGYKYNFTVNRFPISRRGNYADGNEFYGYGTNLSGGAIRNVDILWMNNEKRDNYSVLQIINGQVIIPGNLHVLGNITSTEEITAYTTTPKKMSIPNDSNLRKIIKEELNQITSESTIDEIRNVLINIGQKL